MYVSFDKMQYEFHVKSDVLPLKCRNTQSLVLYFFLRVETLYEYDDTEYINLKNL